MLVVDRGDGRLTHSSFQHFPELLEGDEVLVCNDTRVFPARLLAAKETGGRVELLVLRWEGRRVFAMTRSSKPLRPGQALTVGGAAGVCLTVAAVPANGRAELICPEGTDMRTVCEAHGQTPLPPYIRRDAPDSDPAPGQAGDRERYQTIFARVSGSVAAPTAGLHFSPAVLERIRLRGVQVVTVTHHVGPGTFEPVRVNDVTRHRMEDERFEVSERTAETVNAALTAGRPVVAVGTTAVRCLESAGASGRLAAGPGSTGLFIYPGYRFRVVSRLLTNFHLPGSTLIMLVSALAGRDLVMQAYADAVAQRYRFYSYGDCMFIR